MTMLIIGGSLLFGQHIYNYTTQPAEAPVSNPLKGYAPWIGTKNISYPYTMEFVLLKWSDIEVQEGVYDFDSIEEKLHMNELRKEGHRFILRIVSDYPSDTKHMDIPQWLYDKTGGDGDFYDNAYGKGYSPDYSNPVFIDAHEKLIEAFSEKYASDAAVVCIELGSIGHWGEWHVNYSQGIRRLPTSGITDVYVQHYLSYFPSSKLLMRRPFDIAGVEEMGLYNDSFGQKKSHELWLDWINNGYITDQTGEFLSSMPDFWKFAYSGGEFASDNSLDYYFGEGYEDTLKLLTDSHTSFIGPHSINGVSDAYSDNIINLSREMGYTFRFNNTRLIISRFSGNYSLNIGIENMGIAPIYENWPLFIRISDVSGNIVYENRYDIGIDKILPGQKNISIDMGKMNLKSGSYIITAGIIDPLNDMPGIQFANENIESDGNNMYRIMEFEVR